VAPATNTIGLIGTPVSNAKGGRVVEQPKWEWIDSVFGMVIGVMTAIVGMTGWTSRRFKDAEVREVKLRESIDVQLNAIHGRVTPLMEDVAELRAHHESKMQRLAHIESSIQVIDRKQDEQMRMLYRLVGEKMRRDEE
jgi:hypothetical protein